MKRKATSLSLVLFTLLRRNPGTRRGGERHFVQGLFPSFVSKGALSAQYLPDRTAAHFKKFSFTSAFGLRFPFSSLCRANHRHGLPGSWAAGIILPVHHGAPEGHLCSSCQRPPLRQRAALRQWGASERHLPLCWGGLCEHQAPRLQPRYAAGTATAAVNS